MIRNHRVIYNFVIAVALAAAVPGTALAFGSEGCGAGACTDCHSLTREEAAGILAGVVDNVLSVEPSPVGGLWVVDIEKGGNRWPVYVDFSKKFLLNGQVIRLSNKENVTDTRLSALNRVDVSAIPLEGAIVVGNPKGKKKVVVFSDPDCHYCKVLHEEMKKAAAKDGELAFHVKIYSRLNDPKTARKALAAVCAGTEAALAEAYEGKGTPPEGCKSTAVEETYRLVQKLNLKGTPVLVLPDGRVIRGTRPADDLVRLIDAPPAPAPAGK